MKLLTESALVRGTKFSKTILEELTPLAFVPLDELEKRLKAALDRRRKLLDAKAERELAGKPELPTEAIDIEKSENEIDLIRF
jgi:hypothetical protein